MRTLPVNDERELLLFHVKGTGELTLVSPTEQQRRFIQAFRRESYDIYRQI